MRTPLLSVLASTLFLLPACTSDADEPGLGSVDETKALCASAADTFGKGDIQGAFDRMSEHWPLPKEELDAIAIQSKSQMGLVGNRFGAYVGTEHIRTVSAGASFVRHVFALKFENHAVRFTCAFYKPRTQWLVNNFNWDDKPLIPVDQVD